MVSMANPCDTGLQQPPPSRWDMPLLRARRAMVSQTVGTAMAHRLRSFRECTIIRCSPVGLPQVAPALDRSSCSRIE